MNPDMEMADGKCHCGKVRFRVRLKDGLRSARRCDCSLCRMRGSTPDRHISFFPLQSNLMALGVSRDDTAALRMNQAAPGPDPEVPVAPVWLSIPPSLLKSGQKLPHASNTMEERSRRSSTACCSRGTGPAVLSSIRTSGLSNSVVT